MYIRGKDCALKEIYQEFEYSKQWIEMQMNNFQEQLKKAQEMQPQGYVSLIGPQNNILQEQQNVIAQLNSQYSTYKEIIEIYKQQSVHYVQTTYCDCLKLLSGIPVSNQSIQYSLKSNLQYSYNKPIINYVLEQQTQSLRDALPLKPQFQLIQMQQNQVSGCLTQHLEDRSYIVQSTRPSRPLSLLREIINSSNSIPVKVMPLLIIRKSAYSLTLRAFKQNLNSYDKLFSILIINMISKNNTPNMIHFLHSLMQIQPKIDYSQLLSHFLMFRTTVNRQLSRIDRLFDFEDLNTKEEIQEATNKFEQLDFDLLNGPYETLQDHYEQLEYTDSQSFQLVQTIYAESIVIEKNQAKQYYLMYFEPQIEQVQMQQLYMEIEILDAPDLFGLSIGIGDPVTNKGLNFTSSQLCEENEVCQVHDFKSGGRYGLFIDKNLMQVRFSELENDNSFIIQVYFRLHYEWKHFFVQHHLCKLKITFRSD